jgi:hypothetical protein
MNITNETEWVEYLGCGIPIYRGGRCSNPIAPSPLAGEREGEGGKIQFRGTI